MKKLLTLSILFFLFSITLAGEVINTRPWEYSRTISGIKIFQRSGNSKGIFEFLAITSVNINADTICKTVLDIPANKYWMSDCIYSEYITRINNDEIIAYYVTSPPWPVSRRDSIVRIKTVTEPGRISFTMNSIPAKEAEKYKALNREYIRIYKMDGTVILEETKPGLTEIKFSVASDPSGTVPEFIIRMGGWVIPYKTLAGLKKYMNL